MILAHVAAARNIKSVTGRRDKKRSRLKWLTARNYFHFHQRKKKRAKIPRSAKDQTAPKTLDKEGLATASNTVGGSFPPMAY